MHRTKTISEFEIHDENFDKYDQTFLYNFR